MSYIEMEDGGLLVVKDLPLDCMKIDGETGVIRAVVSDESEDSDSDIIHQGKNKRGRGWVLDRFNAAPVLTWMHNIYEPSLSSPKTRAKVDKLDDGRKALVLDPAEFDLEDPKAALIDGKLRRGSVKEWSVGFKGLIAEPRLAEDGTRGRGYDFYEQQLIEVAVVNRGANYNTSTAIKSLLGAAGMAVDVQTAGDAEANELRSEVEFLDQRIKELEALVIQKLSDPENRACNEEHEEISRTHQAESAKRMAAVAALHDSLTRIGTAHE